ncbi:hypothetical protein K469DRAFT_744137 [Zopfia rhizophila CBS 207.26]|uniref:Helicase C-terminal domain-containing protein n=1 Tax=Zopfia rhizophila CBS 207.26 TaxID=1314779 RepID=A0A6A6EXT0_9PEZI|nr:hypothetical protein K469DRAFT_744137 [Zopfia rhizophila CBS 207.26]
MLSATSPTSKNSRIRWLVLRRISSRAAGRIGWQRAERVRNRQGLVRWYTGVKLDGLQVDNIRSWFKDPENCPMWNAFDEIIKGDEKYKTFMTDVSKLESSRKSSRSNHARNQALVGFRCPVTSLLYLIGMAKQFKFDPIQTSKLDDLAEREVTLVHSGMAQSERNVNIDAFQDIHGGPRYLLTTIDLFAEGTALQAANHVFQIDPHDKADQFFARPNRYGQREEHIYFRQYYNLDSSVDCGIMATRELKKNMVTAVTASK